MNQPPFGLTDQEILCVIAALQTYGGTPTVTMQTTHHYSGKSGAPAGATAPAAPEPAEPKKGAQLRPGAMPHLLAVHHVPVDGASR